MKNNLGFNLTRVGRDSMLLEPYDNLDPSDPEPMIEEISKRLIENNIFTLFYDLNKVLIIDEVYYSWLCHLSDTCTLFQAELKVINMKATAAASISSFIDSKPPFKSVLEM
ncbi:MAG: hypothetical protein ACQEQS_01535 [Thermodesulfobacteriota bacterium]